MPLMFAINAEDLSAIDHYRVVLAMLLVGSSGRLASQVGVLIFALQQWSALHHGATTLFGACLASIVELLLQVEAVLGAFVSVDRCCDVFVLASTHYLVSLVGDDLLQVGRALQS